MLVQKKITKEQILAIASLSGFDYASLMAIREVESGGLGFHPLTGKIIIQFEPSWFKRKAPFTPSGKWSVNGIERQDAEWIAFNDAFKHKPNAAMESTSIGMFQIMGFHFSRLGYKTVGAMWDDFKISEFNQMMGLVKFIKTDPKLRTAVQTRNWHLVAYYYNGSGYQALAKKTNSTPYNMKLDKAYKKYRDEQISFKPAGTDHSAERMQDSKA